MTREELHKNGYILTLALRFVKFSAKEDALEIVTRLDKINTEINKRFGEKII